MTRTAASLLACLAAALGAGEAAPGPAADGASPAGSAVFPPN